MERKLEDLILRIKEHRLKIRFLTTCVNISLSRMLYHAVA
jgi:hypothetical protein